MSIVLGQFEQAVLLAIVRLEDEGYGRAILNEVEARLERAVTAGSVYATLERLEEKQLISSRLVSGTARRGGRARRYYSVGPAGLRALNEARTAFDLLWRGLPWPLGGRS